MKPSTPKTQYRRRAATKLETLGQPHPGVRVHRNSNPRAPGRRQGAWVAARPPSPTALGPLARRRRQRRTTTSSRAATSHVVPSGSQLDACVRRRVSGMTSWGSYDPADVTFLHSSRWRWTLPRWPEERSSVGRSPLQRMIGPEHGSSPYLAAYESRAGGQRGRLARDLVTLAGIVHAQVPEGPGVARLPGARGDAVPGARRARAAGALRARRAASRSPSSPAARVVTTTRSTTCAARSARRMARRGVRRRVDGQGVIAAELARAVAASMPRRCVARPDAPRGGRPLRRHRGGSHHVFDFTSSRRACSAPPSATLVSRSILNDAVVNWAARLPLLPGSPGRPVAVVSRRRSSRMRSVDDPAPRRPPPRTSPLSAKRAAAGPSKPSGARTTSRRRDGEARHRRGRRRSSCGAMPRRLVVRDRATPGARDAHARGRSAFQWARTRRSRGRRWPLIGGAVDDDRPAAGAPVCTCRPSTGASTACCAVKQCRRLRPGRRVPWRRRRRGRRCPRRSRGCAGWRGARRDAGPRSVRCDRATSDVARTSGVAETQAGTASRCRR